MRRVRVTSKTREAEDVVSFVLTGDELPPWTPGAHIDLEVRPGVCRQYSLCGDPADRDRWQVAVLREDSGRGGSRYLHDAVEAGASLRVGGPRNNFPLEPADGYVFVAGGIGITPLIPMFRAAQLLGVDWTLYYGGRRRAKMAFLDALSGYGKRVRILPEDECGLLPLAEIVAESNHPVYCCGPEPLLVAVERLCPPDRLRVERFHPRADALDGPAQGFEVFATLSGAMVRVAPKESILDALDDAGVPVPSSCREGTCGTCETTVLEGEVDHRDSILTDEERTSGNTMMVCVSRARSARLVLDV